VLHFPSSYYPYSGAGSGNEHIINVRCQQATASAEFRAAVSDCWLPALERFQPEMLFISAGFDAHREDDMGGFGLKDDDYGWVTDQLKTLAYRHANRRIVSVLEGGYALHALGRSAAAHIRSLSGL